MILNNLWISVAILTLAIVFFMLELSKNSKGLFALISAGLFTLFFYGIYTYKDLEIISFIPMVIGLVLIILELFIPGVGLPGLIGSISFIYGVWTMTGSVYVTIVYVIVPATVAIFVMIYLLKDGLTEGRLENLVLTNKEDQKLMANANLIGKTGVTTTSLRPVGKALIDGRTVDVITGGSFIDKDTQIIVQSIDGIRVVVEKYK